MRHVTLVCRAALAVGLGLALAACATAAPGAPPGAQGPTAEQTAQRFLEAALAGQVDAAVALVGFPLLWDARCRVLREPGPLRERLARDNPAGKPTSVAILARIRPGEPLPDGLDERARESAAGSLDKLSATSGCDAETDPLLAEGVKGDNVYLLVRITVDGEAVPTVMRVRRSEVGWRVTGLDN